MTNTIGGGNFLNINTAGGGGAAFLADPALIAPLLFPDLPQYVYKNKVTGAQITVTDPARGHISGKYKDLGRFKVPTLRGLSAHAPYFHNGMSATLRDVVIHYRNILSDPTSLVHGVPLTDQEVDDLVAFLGTL
jgi:cytochrome c peroxidase